MIRMLIAFASIILPGIPLVLALFRRKLAVLEFLFLSLSLGASAWIVVVYVAAFLGLPPDQLRILLCTVSASTLPLVLYMVYTRREALATGGKRELQVILTLYVVQMAMLHIYFYKYPIFHSFPLSMDPIFHAAVVKRLMEEGLSPMRTSSYPPGFHALSLVPLSLYFESYLDIRYVAGLFVFLMPLAAYGLMRLTGSSYMEAVLSMYVAIVLQLGMQHLYGMGTYPNLLADFLSYGMFAILVRPLRGRGGSHGLEDSIPILLLSAALILVHSSGMIYISFFLLIYLAACIRSRSGELLILAAILVAPLLPIFMLNWNILLRLVRAASGRLQLVESREPTYLLLKSISPYLAFLYALSRPPLFALIVISVAYYAFMRRKLVQSLLALLTVYLGVLASFAGSNAMRIALISLNYAAPLSGSLLAELLSRVQRAKTINRGVNLLAFIVLLYFIATFSPLRFYSRIILSNMGFVRAKQLEVYDSMLWIRDNTSKNSTVISIVLPYYNYLEVVADRRFLGDYYMNSSEISSIAGARIAAVWKYFKYYHTYEETLEKIYENKHVGIFKIKQGT